MHPSGPQFTIITSSYRLGLRRLADELSSNPAGKTIERIFCSLLGCRSLFLKFGKAGL